MRRDFLRVLLALSGLGIFVMAGFMTNSRKRKPEEEALEGGFTAETRAPAELGEESLEDHQAYLDRLSAYPQYDRPPNDPSIIWEESPVIGNPNFGKLLDTKTGDFFDLDFGERDSGINRFTFVTKRNQIVCTFSTKFGPGIYGKGDWPAYPVRVFRIREPRDPTDEIAQARSQISVPRFAQFLTALPSFNSRGGTQFVVIDAPLPIGQQL